MMPSGPPTPIGGQSMPPSLLRSNSGMLVGQGGQMPPQAAFSSLMSPRTQYNNGNLHGNNVPSVSSLLNQSFVNGGANSSLSGNVNNPLVGIDVGAESDPLSGVANAMGYNPPSSSLVPTSLTTAGPPGQVQGHQLSMPSGSQLRPDQQHTQQLETPKYQYQHGQQQFSANLSNQQQPQQPPQQFQSIRGGLADVPSVKLELEVTNDQHGPQQQSHQQLQTLRSVVVKMEQEQQPQRQGMRPSVKKEPLHSDQSLPLHQQQQQQQQQLLQMSMSRQFPQAAAAQQINILQQQRMLQLQQQRLKTLPQQRSQVPQQFQQQNMAIRLPTKSAYEAGMCARRLTQYMYLQQHRPDDNNIEFWRKFVSDYFAPNAKKKWCVSMYGSGRQTTGVFPQDAWHCEICNHKPGRGFEATFEVLPRLFKIKYESGTLEELLYIDMPREYHNNSGQIVLDYAKAIQESVFEHLRVVRDGQLRVVFSPDLKICSWEFCARKHEELIPRRLLIPQISQLGSTAQKYQTATQTTSSSNLSVSDLQNNCNMFVSSARQLAKTLEVPLVNDLGYTKRYVRCLQISEVVNSMKDLIDYSRITGTGPMESLVKFPRRTSIAHGIPGQNQQPDEQQRQQQQPPQHQPSLQQQPSPQQQSMVQNSNNDPSSVEAAVMQVVSSNGVPRASNTLNISPGSTSASTIAGLLHQNSMNARQSNSLSNANSPYCGNALPSPGGSLSTMQQGQTNPSSFQSPPTPSSSNNPSHNSHNSALVANNHMRSTNPLANISGQQQPAFSGEGEANDSQNSVQRVLQEMMTSGQLNGGAGGMTGVSSLGDEIKSVNGALPQSINTGSLNGVNCLLGHGPSGSNSGMVDGGVGYVNGSGGIGQSVMVNGIRNAMGNNPAGMNGRVGLLTRDQSMSHQQQDTGSQLLGGLGSGNGFNSLQFDWKPSP